MKIRMWIDTGLVGASHEDECELPDNWSKMSTKAREKYLQEVAQEYLHERCEAGAEVVEGDVDE